MGAHQAYLGGARKILIREEQSYILRSASGITYFFSPAQLVMEGFGRQ